MKPLSKKARLGSGAILVLFFIILAPLILADSFGYSWEKIEDAFTFVKKGGIYVASDISNVEIYIDDEYFKDNGLFIRNTLIQDLDPNKIHTVVAQKEGFHDWRKELPVYESLVTESRLLMLPLEIETEEIYPYVDFEGNGTTTATSSTRLITDDDILQEYLVGGYIPTNSEYRQLINLFSQESGDVYSTSTSAEEIQTRLEDALNATTSTSTKKEIPEYFIDLGIQDPEELENLIILKDQVAWLDDGNVLLNWINKENNPNHFYCLDLLECRTQITLDWVDDIIKFNFLPGRFDVFVVLVGDGVYAVEADDRSERNIQPIYLGEDLDFVVNGNEIIVKDGLIFHIVDNL